MRNNDNELYHLCPIFFHNRKIQQISYVHKSEASQSVSTGLLELNFLGAFMFFNIHKNVLIWPLAPKKLNCNTILKF